MEAGVQGVGDEEDGDIPNSCTLQLGNKAPNVFTFDFSFCPLTFVFLMVCLFFLSAACRDLSSLIRDQPEPPASEAQS